MSRVHARGLFSAEAALCTVLVILVSSTAFSQSSRCSNDMNFWHIHDMGCIYPQQKNKRKLSTGSGEIPMISWEHFETRAHDLAKLSNWFEVVTPSHQSRAVKPWYSQMHGNAFVGCALPEFTLNMGCFPKRCRFNFRITASLSPSNVIAKKMSLGLYILMNRASLTVNSDSEWAYSKLRNVQGSRVSIPGGMNRELKHNNRSK